MKISTLIVSIILIGLFSSIFAVFLSNVSTQYGADYNETAFNSYNKIQNVSSQTEDIRSGLSTEGGDTGITDLIGGFLKKGFAVIQITFSSFDLLNSMSEDAISQIDEKTGGSGLSLFSPAILAIVAVLFVFIIISVLVGRDM